jgi:hypothetical protein
MGPASLLDVRVTKNSLDRALTLANAIVRTLETEKLPVTTQAGKHSTSTLIFGHSAITEKVPEIGRRKVTEYSWTRTAVDYVGTGIVESALETMLTGGG